MIKAPAGISQLIASLGSDDEVRREASIARLAIIGARAVEGLRLPALEKLVARADASRVAARGAPVWLQLYPTGDWSVTQKLLGGAKPRAVR